MITQTATQALIYPTGAQRGIDLVTVQEEQTDNALDFHPMPGEDEWSIGDATAALATLGYAPVGEFARSDDLGGGCAGWEVEVEAR